MKKNFKPTIKWAKEKIREIQSGLLDPEEKINFLYDLKNQIVEGFESLNKTQKNLDKERRIYELIDSTVSLLENRDEEESFDDRIKRGAQYFDDSDRDPLSAPQARETVKKYFS